MNVARNPDKEEKVLNSAHHIFLRFGYNRTTMSDLAKAAEISRPALYLIYPNKEAIFRAVITRYYEQTKQHSEQAIQASPTLEAKLAASMKLWIENVYQEVANAPERNEIYELSYTIIADLRESLSQIFITQLQEILENAPEVSPARLKEIGLTTHDLAELIAQSCAGFKREAKSLPQLQSWLHNLRQLNLAALNVA